MFPPVGGVGLGGGSGSWIDDEFSGRRYDWLEGLWDDVVVLLYGNQLRMVEELSDKSKLDGVLQYTR